MAGDDDQTIYGFQGADPNYFINLKGTFDNQIYSHRVPKKIHANFCKIPKIVKNQSLSLYFKWPFAGGDPKVIISNIC